MLVYNNIIETQNFLKSQKQKSIGFVPTMGALHDGHLALVKRSIAENNLTAVSIFVNPTQFNNPDDLIKYPRTLKNDFELLAEAGCDIVFAPSAEEMYPQLPQLTLNFGYLENSMEGKFRPGHFNGVGIVVSKLFNIIQPNNAYFGQKDIQQVSIINRLINDLSYGIKLIVCDTIRETDGLAMSSRNLRLTAEVRPLASKIFESLKIGKKILLEGKDPFIVKKEIEDFYNSNPELKLEYYEITDFETLKPIHEYDKNRKTALIIAAHLGGVRLIDNLVF
jgi:pantoate--beta-alanine ligase